MYVRTQQKQILLSSSASNGALSPNVYYRKDSDPPQSIVLENSSCNVKPGELIGVIGHMGSGKSTFVSAIAGEEHRGDRTACPVPSRPVPRSED